MTLTLIDPDSKHLNSNINFIFTHLHNFALCKLICKDICKTYDRCYQSTRLVIQIEYIPRN